jgi:integrase
LTTPEATKAIDTYLEMRASYGEKINEDSYLIREYFNTRGPIKIRNARNVTTLTLEWKLIEMARRCHIRKVEHQIEGKKIASMRKDVAIAHGFRKFFATMCASSKVDPEIRERLLGHDIGLTLDYVKTTEQEIYQEYQKAFDLLTINEENRLRKKVETLLVEKSRLEVLSRDVELLKVKYKKLKVLS